jgi:hypothetical protein
MDAARGFLALYARLVRGGAAFPDIDDETGVAGVTGASLAGEADLPLPAALLGG